MGEAMSKPSAVYRNRLQRYPDAVWLIWSNKWNCWYRDKCAGYTNDIAQAGLYDRETAAQHYVDGPPRYRDVEPFPLSVVRAMLTRRRAEIQADAAGRLARIDAALAGHLSATAPQGQAHA